MASDPDLIDPGGACLTPGFCSGRRRLPAHKTRIAVIAANRNNLGPPTRDW